MSDDEKGIMLAAVPAIMGAMAKGILTLPLPSQILLTQLPAMELSKIAAPIVQEFARAILAEREAATMRERERCAKIAETFSNAQHLAHDMQTGVFPVQSRSGVAISAAIIKGEA